jgi:hypothetical protein
MSSTFRDIEPIRLSAVRARRAAVAGRSESVERSLGLSAILVAATLAACVYAVLPGAATDRSRTLASQPSPSSVSIYDTSKGVKRL